MFTPKLPIEKMLALNIIIYRFQIGVRQVAWECQWKSKFKVHAYLTHVYIQTYVHAYIIITVWKTEFNRPPNRKSCFFGATTTPQKNFTLHFWCQGRRVFAWKVPSSFRQVGGADRGSGVIGDVRSGCCATIIFKKTRCWLDDTKDDWRWLDVDFFSQNMFLYVFGILGVFFWRMRIVFILEFCRSSNYMFSSHRWDY